MKKRFFVLLLCLAAALGIFAAAAETPQNVDAEVNKYIFYVNDASGSTAVFQSAVLEKGQSLSQPKTRLRRLTVMMITIASRAGMPTKP